MKKLKGEIRLIRKDMGWVVGLNSSNIRVGNILKFIGSKGGLVKGIVLCVSRDIVKVRLFGDACIGSEVVSIESVKLGIVRMAICKIISNFKRILRSKLDSNVVMMSPLGCLIKMDDGKSMECVKVGMKSHLRRGIREVLKDLKHNDTPGAFSVSEKLNKALNFSYGHYAGIIDGKIVVFTKSAYSNPDLRLYPRIDGNPGAQYYCYPELICEESRDNFIIKNDERLKKYLMEKQFISVKGSDKMISFPRSEIVMDTLSHYPVVEGSPSFLLKSMKSGMLQGDPLWIEKTLGIVC